MVLQLRKGIAFCLAPMGNYFSRGFLSFIHIVLGVKNEIADVL
jgi:hypothetical protein